jgi:hypothetical protein
VNDDDRRPRPRPSTATVDRDLARSLDLRPDPDYRVSPPPMPAPLLLEIGVEELPSTFVDAALAALPGLVTSSLAGVRLTHGAVRALGTPRRLAVLVDDVTDRQTDVNEDVTGPPETAAFKDGAPTKAAEAFAAKIGVGVGDLNVVEKPGEQEVQTVSEPERKRDASFRIVSCVPNDGDAPSGPIWLAFSQERGALHAGHHEVV